MCDNENCSGCENEVRISLDSVPEEVVALVQATAQVAIDYPLAVTGVKKRSTEARKALMDIKKLALEMRKMAIEKCNAARESKGQ